MKKIILFLVLFTLSIPNFSALAKDKEMPDIYGHFGIAMDARTGDVLYDKLAKERAYPASMTKMVTAMLLEEYVEDGEVMIVSETAAGQEASNQYFKLIAGEKISKEDAMEALLLISANDVAVTIAEHISGTQEAFAKLMTEKAVEIGAKNTNFVTASGLHDPNHYSTAYDMALIAKEVLNYPDVLAVMGTKTAQIETSERALEITNPSKIHDNPLALGGKTGYTHTAQNTLVEILEKDNKLVIAVVMKTTLAEEYKDIEVMGNHAFDQIGETNLYLEKGEIVQTKSKQKEEIEYAVGHDIYITGSPDLSQRVTETELAGEIQKGDVIGELTLEKDGVVVQQVPLVATKDFHPSEGTKKKTTKGSKNDKESVSSFSIWNVFIAIFVPLVLYVLYIVYYNKKKRREMKTR